MATECPSKFLCGMICVVDDQLCPAYYACPVNEVLVKGIFNRYITSCRRELKRWNKISLQYQDLEKLVRWNIMEGFCCPICGVPMTVNDGQAEEDHIYTIEHVTPLGKGGTNTIENIILCCNKCNKESNARHYPPQRNLNNTQTE